VPEPTRPLAGRPENKEKQSCIIWTGIPAVALAVSGDVLPIQIIDIDQVVAEVTQKYVDRWCYAVTPNLQHIDLLYKHDVPIDLYQRSDLVLADGWPVALVASRKFGSKVPKVPGSDLLERILNEPGMSRPIVFVGGSTSEFHILAERAGAKGWKAFHEPAPRAQLIDSLRRTKLVSQIARQGSGGIVIIGVGAPRQEILASDICAQPGSGWVLCLGMAINFSSGAVRRAPRLMSHVGLEWLYRAMQEPRRLFPRYASNSVALVKLLRENI
jgi:exopolysaccharide biosynthesis WecB/TagA/CpsF family protein